MSEQIFAAFIRSDKAKTLRIIEPFYDASCHYNFLFQLSWAYARFRSFDEARKK
ncbi:hypothetical protein BN2497_13581 [Janthinobacterium sp. CG23_2]|nr:hypothetical protein BN2497_13581 [Janthinobacterium sp. CG23_2]CUU33188.1 hypothetical protein BN3177_13581 [Janthinobacterium sp. CG23_2]